MFELQYSVDLNKLNDDDDDDDDTATQSCQLMICLILYMYNVELVEQREAVCSLHHHAAQLLPCSIFNSGPVSGNIIGQSPTADIDRSDTKICCWPRDKLCVFMSVFTSCFEVLYC